MRPTDQEPLSRAPEARENKPVQPTLGRYVACYVLYLVVLATCYVNFVLWNSAVQTTAVAIIGREISLEAAYAFPMVIIITILFVVAIWAEHVLRTAVPRGELRRAFNRIAVRLIATALIAVVLITVVDPLIAR